VVLILLHIVMQRPLDSHQDSSLDESQDSAASTAASIELETLGYINTKVCRLSFSESPRSIDDYYQTAFTNAYQVDYLVMIMALGFSNVGDATELFSIGYVLADSDFQESILGGEMHNKAATVAGMSSVGLIVGGLGIWVFEMYWDANPLYCWDYVAQLWLACWAQSQQTCLVFLLAASCVVWVWAPFCLVSLHWLQSVLRPRSGDG